MNNFYRNNSYYFYNPYKNKYYNNCTPYPPSAQNNYYNKKNNYENNTLINNNDSIDIKKAELKNLPPNKDFILDIFGLKLYFDDILILSLLYFLYEENVKDEGLFLALVLLLIS